MSSDRTQLLAAATKELSLQPVSLSAYAWPDLGRYLLKAGFATTAERVRIGSTSDQTTNALNGR